jgi:tetratricopeptide (TPR) repeat protein
MLPNSRQLIFLFFALFISTFAVCEIEKISENDKRVAELKIDEFLQKANKLISKEDSIFYAIKLLEEAYNIAEQNRLTDKIIHTSNRLGMANLGLANNAKSTSYFYISLKNAESINDKKGISGAYLGLGLVIYNLGNYEEAFLYFNKSNKIEDESELQHNNMLMEYLIGLCHFQMKDFARSRQYLERVLDDALQKGDSERQYEAKLFLLNIRSIENPKKEQLSEYNEILNYFSGRNE